MAWAQNLLRVPNTFFLSLAWWLERRFGIFPAAVSQWLGHKTCWGSAFSHARPKHLFLEFGLVACRLPSLTLRKGLPCLRQPFFFVFSRFQKQRFALSLFGIFRRFHQQRFGSFLAAVSHGLGIYISFFLMDSNSDVSAFFRLRFRNGLGTKPAGVLPFRMRVPNTFFLSLAWWLAGFFFVLVGSKSNVSAVFWQRFRMVWALYFFLFSGFQKRRFGILLAAVSQWLGHKTYWGSAFSHARPKHLFLEFGLVTCRFFLCF